MRNFDPILNRPKQSFRAEIPRRSMIHSDAPRIKQRATDIGLSQTPNRLTPDQLDEQIRQFFAVEQI